MHDNLDGLQTYVKLLTYEQVESILFFSISRHMPRRNYMQKAVQLSSLVQVRVGKECQQSFSMQASTLVLAEHEAGFIKAPSVSAVVAANSVSKDNSISVLLAGSGPSLQEAAAHAASCHPSVSQVAKPTLSPHYCAIDFRVFTALYFCFH